MLVAQLTIVQQVRAPLAEDQEQEVMTRALRRDAPLRLATCALLLLLACGIVRRPEAEGELYLLDCTSAADCSAVAGATCAKGWCVDVETGDRIHQNALDSRTGDVGSCTVSEQVPNPPVEDQAALDVLEGCEKLYGDLDLRFAADLRPLHALRNLLGRLTIRPEQEPQSSLEGLENLELVSGGLQLTRLAVPSLKSLAGLRSVGAPPGGGLSIAQSTGLRDLSGLERLAELNELIVADLPDLVSIDALQLPDRLEWIVLQDVPLLSAAEALRSVRAVDTLILSNTGLGQVDMLARQSVRSLSLVNNPRLTDATGIGAVEELELRGNAQLTTLALPQRISGLQTLMVYANPSLQSITGLDQLPFFGALRVRENPALATLRLPGLQTLRDLDVVRNPRLSSIDLPLLIEPVQNLVVVSNANLPPDSLFPIASRARNAKVAGNQGEAIGLDPCPYQRDGYCDAPPIDNLCALGADQVDCGN
ncbi:MAG: hypothetical protein ABI895_20195 [Deltaproteobacteria bacterium]